MEANSSLVLMLPTQGDFAAGLRTQPSVSRIRGSFATGVLRSAEPRSQRHGDFAAGIRARVHSAVAHHGDFAGGLRAAESPSAA